MQLASIVDVAVVGVRGRLVGDDRVFGHRHPRLELGVLGVVRR